MDLQTKPMRTLFLDVARILGQAEGVPNNVKSLLSHDKGNAFRIILHVMDEFCSDVDHKVIDARQWNCGAQDLVSWGSAAPTAYDAAIHMHEV